MHYTSNNLNHLLYYNKALKRATPKKTFSFFSWNIMIWLYLNAAPISTLQRPRYVGKYYLTMLVRSNSEQKAFHYHRVELWNYKQSLGRVANVSFLVYILYRLMNEVVKWNEWFELHKNHTVFFRLWSNNTVLWAVKLHTEFYHGDDTI